MIVEYAGGMKPIAHDRGLQAVGDQPEHGGGEGTAMTPTKLFIASLAMCVGIFVLYLAKRHEMPFENMRIEVNHQMAQ